MTRGPQYTPERKRELMRQAAILWASGKTYKEISETIGVPDGTLVYWRKGCPDDWKPFYEEAVRLVGEPKHRRHYKVAPEVVEEAARMHAAGKTFKEIGEHFGVTKNCVEVWKCVHREVWEAAWLEAFHRYEAPPPKPAQRPSDPSKPARTLWSLQKMMFAHRANIRRQTTRKHYRYAINCFGKFLGRAANEADLNDDTMVAWMQSLIAKTEDKENPRSIDTMRSYVERVRALWRFLNDRGEVPTRPTFSLPPLPEPVPIALDESQIHRLFEAALCRPGLVDGIPARYWWPALFGFAFCTSERRGAIFALRWEWVDLQTKSVSIPAIVRKGGLKNATYRLWDEVCWLLSRIVEPRRELVFPWPHSDATYYHRYGRILIDAQIPNTRKHKTHSLRVTHNTWTRVMTGEHSPLLMHADKATSERHYEDRRFTVREPVKLPIPWQITAAPPVRQPVTAPEPKRPSIAAETDAMAWL